MLLYGDRLCLDQGMTTRWCRTRRQWRPWRSPLMVLESRVSGNLFLFVLPLVWGLGITVQVDLVSFCSFPIGVMVSVSFVQGNFCLSICSFIVVTVCVSHWEFVSLCSAIGVIVWVSHCDGVKVWVSHWEFVSLCLFCYWGNGLSIICQWEFLSICSAIGVMVWVSHWECVSFCLFCHWCDGLSSPHELTFTWCGCCCLCFWHKPTELAHSFLFCSIYVFLALSTVFHSINSPSTLRFLTLFFWSYFCLIGPLNLYLFVKASLSPDIILCGWLGLRHQLTN